MKLKIKISIGIAAYNAEKNIHNLLTSLLKQKHDGFEVNKIIIHSDASSDDTVKIAKKIRNRKVIIIDNKVRQGFAGSLNNIIKLTHDDLLILLNDDIRIKDQNFINKLVKPFLLDHSLYLASGHPIPAKATTFIEAAVNSSWSIFDKMKLAINDGNNGYSCDGKVLVLSKSFLDKFSFPRNLKEMGNVDSYLYLSCIKAGNKFHYVRNANVYYKSPSSLNDYTKWFIRSNATLHTMRDKFGTLVDQEYPIPTNLYIKYSLQEAFKNPLGSLFIIIMKLYIKIKSVEYAKHFNPTWEVVTTTKNI